MLRPAIPTCPQWFPRLTAFAVVLLLSACGGSGGGAARDPDGGGPTVSAVSPCAGFVTGGGRVTLEGTGFQVAGPPTVTFGGTPGTDVQVLDDTRLSVTVPAGAAPGPMDLTVSSNNGAGTLPGVFQYVRFPVVRAPGADLRPDAGGSEVLYNAPFVEQAPRLVSFGKRVYVAYLGFVSGTDDAVLVNHSDDGGTTWQAAPTRVNTPGGLVNNISAFELVASGDHVYVVWNDSRSPGAGLRFNRSADGGRTWLSQDKLVDSTISSWFRACCDGAHFYVVQRDGRLGSFSLFCNASHDGGATFSTSARQISATLDGGGVNPGREFEVCCTGERIHVVWSDDRGGSTDVWTNRSLDGGVTWPTADIRIDDDATGARADHPSICCHGESVYVAFLDDRDAPVATDVRTVQLAISTTAGASFMNPVPVPLTATDATLAPDFWAPVLCCSEAGVHVGWREAASAGAPFEPHVRSFRPDGVPLSGAVRLTDELPVGTTSASNPLLCCAPGVVHAAWIDARLGPGNSGLFVRSSSDGGASWSAQSTRIDSPVAAPHTIGFVAGLGCDGARCVAGWIDTRDAPAAGRADLFVQRTIP